MRSKNTISTRDHVDICLHGQKLEPDTTVINDLDLAFPSALEVIICLMGIQWEKILVATTCFNGY